VSALVCFICGHLQEEHADTFIQPCEVEGCECEVFEPGEDEDAEEPR